MANTFKTILFSCVTMMLLISVLPAQELAGFAMLPAGTFTGGPTSGQFINSANGVEVPFAHRQPVQGFSSVLNIGGGKFLVISDNGFGSKENSPDFLLHVYEIIPDFKTAGGGTGTISVKSLFVISDPDFRLNFPIVADSEFYPGGEKKIPVDPAIRERRLLTGADLDIESFRRLPDGTFWFGDEFGPFLVHSDSSGKILDPPVALTGVMSPQNPFLGDKIPNAERSGGFEPLALSINGKTLYPMLEKPLVGAPKGQLNIYRFDPLAKKFISSQPFQKYRLEEGSSAVADFTAISDHTFMAVERDDTEGVNAAFKRIFLLDLDKTDADGYLVKRELVNLVRIPDPANIGGMGDIFTFPFQTIESIAVVDGYTIGVLNDNNYPFSVGRHTDTSMPDDSEFILIRFTELLTRMSVVKSVE